MALLKYKNRAPRVFAGGSTQILYGVPFHHKSDIRIILRSDSLLEKLTQAKTRIIESIEPLNQYALLSKGELKLISKLEFDYVDGRTAEDELILQLFSVAMTVIDEDDKKYLYYHKEIE